MSKSEKTKSKIIDAAKNLFMERGYNHVTVREIANSAGISHTTIYLYYKDKSELLNEIALPPLIEFEQRILTLFNLKNIEPRKLVKEIGLEMVIFGLKNKTMYDVYFNQGSVNVELEDPFMLVNKIRNRLFTKVKESFSLLYPSSDERDLLLFSRTYYFFLNGLINSYINNIENVGEVLIRLDESLGEMLDIIVYGTEKHTL